MGMHVIVYAGGRFHDGRIELRDDFDVLIAINERYADPVVALLDCERVYRFDGSRWGSVREPRAGREAPRHAVMSPTCVRG
jgi:hypothetical protein